MYKNLNIINEDPFFRKKVISKFLNKLFFDGKKHIGENYLSLFFLTMKTNSFFDTDTDTDTENTSTDCCNFFIRALGNLRINIDVKEVPVGGTSFAISFPKQFSFQHSSIIKSFVQEARSKAIYKKLDIKLLKEFLYLSEGNSPLFHEVTDLIERAEEDVISQHFRWY